MPFNLVKEQIYKQLNKRYTNKGKNECMTSKEKFIKKIIH